MDADLAAIADATKEKSPFVYASLVDFDPTTNLSTVSILGGEIANVPKLAHVSLLEETEVLVDTGNAADATTFSIPIPSNCESGIRVEVTGRLTGSLETITLRVNNDSTAGLYRNTRSSLDAGIAGGSSGSSTGWTPGRMSNITSMMDIRIIPVEGFSIHNGSTQMHSIGFDASGVTAQVASGRLNSTRTIVSLDFIASSNWNTATTWRLYGSRFYESPPQLLCIKTKQVPLTIVGVLSGSTV